MFPGVTQSTWPASSFGVHAASPGSSPRRTCGCARPCHVHSAVHHCHVSRMLQPPEALTPQPGPRGDRSTHKSICLPFVQSSQVTRNGPCGDRSTHKSICLPFVQSSQVTRNGPCGDRSTHKSICLPFVQSSQVTRNGPCGDRSTHKSICLPFIHSSQVTRNGHQTPSLARTAAPGGLPQLGPHRGFLCGGLGPPGPGPGARMLGCNLD